jgi:hypothetical protein
MGGVQDRSLLTNNPKNWSVWYSRGTENQAILLQASLCGAHGKIRPLQGCTPGMLVQDSANASDDLLRDLAEQSDCSGSSVCCGQMSSSKAKTIMKTWTVVANTGQQADLESGLDKKEVQKPTHISAREFVHWLAPQSHVDDDSLRSLFKL